MNINFRKAKNGELTAVVDNHFIHSSYNPSREAKQIVENLNINFNPSLFIILEPGIPYIVNSIKEKYPKTKIAIIRYTSSFSDFNQSSDYVINYYEHENDLKEYIYNNFGEELLLSSYIIQWPASEHIFPLINKTVIKNLKEILVNSKTLLITREFYESKWLLNTLNFLKYTKNYYFLNGKINKDIIIISSGPSLKKTIPLIKKNRKLFFIICLSSAIKICIENKIIPDICFTTDGGYWAGQHLKILEKTNIPIAIPLEGYIQKKLLQNKKIIPLKYDDGISSEIINKFKIPNMKAIRNGTVTGTALLFAISNSQNDIFMAGVDMCNQKGFQHTQPNELELNNCLKDNKINSIEKRLSIAELTSSSLNIYKEWFDHLQIKERNIFRIIEKELKKNTLGNIKDIDIYQFSTKIKNIKCTSPNYKLEQKHFKLNTKTIMSYINENIDSNKWQHFLYPLSFTSLRNNENENLKIKINEKINNLKSKIEKILNE